MNEIDALKSGNKMLAEAIDTLVALDWFSAENWYRTGACDQWSVKDIIAHLSSFETLLNDLLLSLEEGAMTPALQQYIADPQHFNHMQVALREEKSVGELLAEYEQAHALNVNWLPHISEEKRIQIGAIPWFGAEQTPADFIIYAAYDHKREHVDQIMAFISHITPQPDMMSRTITMPAINPITGTWNRILNFAKLSG